MGLIQGLLGGKGINKNRLFPEVTLKRGGHGGEKVRGDGSRAAPSEISLLLSSTRSQPDEDLVQLSNRSFVQPREQLINQPQKKTMNHVHEDVIIFFLEDSCLGLFSYLAPLCAENKYGPTVSEASLLDFKEMNDSKNHFVDVADTWYTQLL